MSRTLFPATPTSVLDLANRDPAARARSRERIARAYRRPVQRYIQVRWTTDPDSAEDLTQSFFETALGRDLLAGYDPARGRFRTYLRTCIDRHVIDRHRAASAAIRGGDRIHVEIAKAEAVLVTDPEREFEAEWLRSIMELALERLFARLVASGKHTHVVLFREFHLADPPTYEEAAARHQISVSNVRNWLHAARRELRRVALELLAEITVDDEDFASEAMAVFGIDVRKE